MLAEIDLLRQLVTQELMRPASAARLAAKQLKDVREEVVLAHGAATELRGRR